MVYEPVHIIHIFFIYIYTYDRNNHLTLPTSAFPSVIVGSLTSTSPPSSPPLCSSPPPPFSLPPPPAPPPSRRAAAPPRYGQGDPAATASRNPMEFTIKHGEK